MWVSSVAMNRSRAPPQWQIRHAQLRVAVEHVTAGEELAGEVLLGEEVELVVVRDVGGARVGVHGAVDDDRDVEVDAACVQRIPPRAVHAWRGAFAVGVGADVGGDEAEFADAPVELGQAVGRVRGVDVVGELAGADEPVGERSALQVDRDR